VPQIYFLRDMGSGIWYLGYGIWGKWSLEESCRLNFTILALVVTPLKQHNLAKQQSTPLLTAYSYVSWPKKGEKTRKKSLSVCQNVIKCKQQQKIM